jgi:hypothetical protein
VKFAGAQETSPDILANDIATHVRYLASDELEGRASGAEGNRKAARYIAALFENYGLKPAGDKGSYFQEFSFVSSLKLGSKNSLSFEQLTAPERRWVLEPDVDFRPFGFTTNASTTGELVFAGYGISAADKGYDDYEDLAVEGKFVIVLRYSPDGNDPHSEFFSRATFRSKARVAREHGAAGLIVVTGPRDDEDDKPIKMTFDNAFASSGIQAISVKRRVLDEILEHLGKDLGTIQDSIRSKRKPQSFEIPGVMARVETDVQQVNGTTSNIVGYIDGNDAGVLDEVIIIGAHMDHLGFGGPGSGSLDPDTLAIHNGADDNASGTAGLLELAEVFASQKESLQRSLLFIAFSGEELGTLGSGHYVNNPFTPLDKTIAMINMDMIGRLEDKSLTIYGTGTSPSWSELLQRHNVDSSFSFKLVDDGYGPSDHAQFYGKDIPVLFFFTGIHNDYHKPSDDWQLLNTSGEKEILELVYDVTMELNRMPNRPEFARAQSASPDQGASERREFAVTLGVIPDYGSSAEGMKIGGLRPGGPAELAGMKSGDIIVQLHGKKIMNIYDYMDVLGTLSPDKETDAQVQRDGSLLNLVVKPGKRK